MVDRAGFLQTPHLGPGQLAVVLNLNPKHELRNVVLQLTPGSVVTGRVLDPEGDPAPDVPVQALQFHDVLGKRQLQMVAMSKTNDLGEYRLYGLSRGKYFIGATLSVAEGNAAERYGVTYSPNAVDLSAAAPIAVKEASQTGGVDIASVMPTLVDVSGRVSCSSGRLRPDTVVALTHHASDAAVATTPTAGVDAEGHFRFRGVAPGVYTIFASFTDGPAQYAGTQAIEVRNTEISNVDMQLNRAVAFSGKILNEGSTQNINLNSLRVLLEPKSDVLAGSLVGDVNADGGFLLPGVLPSQYALKIVGLPDQYYLKRIQIGSEEIAGREIDFRYATGSLDLLISSSGGSIHGDIVDGEQQPAVGVNVALIPDPPRPDTPDLYKFLRSNANGEFTILGVAPGHYQLFAIEGPDEDAYLGSDLPASFQKYVHEVAIEENSSVTLRLRADPPHSD
jgi:hypothetical protein